MIGCGLNLLLSKFFNKDKRKVLTLRSSMVQGFLLEFSMIASQSALIFISYPVKILMKSSKIIAIITLNTIFPTGKVIKRYKYVACVLIAIGLVFFNMRFHGHKRSSYTGILLCSISLLFDGVLSNIQDTNRHKLNPSFYEVHFQTTLWASICGVGYAVITG